MGHSKKKIDNAKILYLLSCAGATLFQNFIKKFDYFLTHEATLFQLLQQNF
jgi:hypothetical protein